MRSSKVIGKESVRNNHILLLFWDDSLYIERLIYNVIVD